MESVHAVYYGPWECVYEVSDSGITITHPSSPNLVSNDLQSPAQAERTTIYDKSEGGRYLSRDGFEVMEMVKDGDHVRLRHYTADGDDTWTLVDVHSLKTFQ